MKCHNLGHLQGMAENKKLTFFCFFVKCVLLTVVKSCFSLVGFLHGPTGALIEPHRAPQADQKRPLKEPPRNS